MHWMTATALAAEVRAGRLSARDLLQATIARIERHNPTINAVVATDFERARAAAAAADEAQARGQVLGVLHGLPVAHKDMFATAGLRTTYGSALYADHVPQEDAEIVARQKRAGAITVGKTNTPEFAAGSHTFNAVYGATRNPFDLARSAGGSSGGSSAALAAGLLPLADGTDLGGSLRNPASFCNVVGLRPSLGWVPGGPSKDVWSPLLSMAGPMARSVQDIALYMAAIAGEDPREPTSLPGDGTPFLRPLARDFKGARIAWGGELCGWPLEPGILDVLRRTLPVFEALGCVVESACPGFDGADEAFQVLRGHSMEARYGALLDSNRAALKDSVVWNIEFGRALAGPRIAAASALRSALFQRMRGFLDEHDFLLLPVTQVLPFPIEQEYPASIAGVAMPTYIDWMKSCYHVTMTGHPAISVPGGFSEQGLPVGLQIVGRYRRDFELLQFAHAFEQATRHGERHPGWCA